MNLQNILNANQVLSQLSYVPVFKELVGVERVELSISCISDKRSKPTELHAHNLKQVMGLKPTTSYLEGRSSIN